MIIVEVDLGTRSIVTVTKESNKDSYTVTVDNEVKHPNCSAEDVMRAMGHYIHSLSHQLKNIS